MTNNFSTKEFPSCRAVVHQMALRAPSGLSARLIAELVGYSNYNTMMSELSGQPGHKLGADMLLPLMDVSGSDAPVRFLAEERGGVFIKLPQSAANAEQLVQSLSKTIKEFGAFASDAAQNVSDGVIDSAEMSKIERYTNDVIEAVMAFRKLAKLTHEAKFGV